ncbi:hypothetical protein [Rhizobium sp. BK008]|uniref:hypothetical protein n=1 Tax=Rhizobium sp. BK008 TaxID=2587094 RepID=UPI00161E5141|nr:hypothetical protein [Rhizobium sp. BK008]MBB4255300.1 hypothetical protein [Rhizobium sp. BK008]
MVTVRAIPARLRRSAAVAALCGGLVLFTAGVSHADAKSAADKLLSEASFQTNSMVSMMVDSCPGGDHGKNPSGYEKFAKQGNEVIKQLGDLRVALAKEKGKPGNFEQQIDAILAGLDGMVATLKQNCPGGAHGKDPPNYGALLVAKQNVVYKMDIVETLFE